MKTAVVLLAGGEGRRIGGGKPLRRLGGRTLLERALGRATHWGEIVAIAVRDPIQLPAATQTLLTDDPAIEGPLAGLDSALRFARAQGCEAVLTIPCDSPFLPRDLLDRLAGADARAAIARSGGRLHPVCGLWRVEGLGEMPAYLASGRRSLLGFADALGFVAVDWPEGPFFNINSPEDLAAAEARL